MGQLHRFLKAPLKPTFAVFMFLSVIYIICAIYGGLFSSKPSRPKSNWEKEFQELQNNEEFSFFSKTIQPFQGEILVHVDLKGAPPKLSFLLEFISYVKKLGATGLLIEYEDMFPYHDGLEGIAAANAYHLSQIAQITKQAEENNLFIVPLLPTFGRFDFVLKLEQYRRFREVDEISGVLCPSEKDIYRVLEKMIDQILAAHPKAKYFHIGCDEPGFLGMCRKCQSTMRKNKWRADDIYFNHVRRVAQYIVGIHPGVKPIIWGHKIVRENEKIILTHNIPGLVDVMVYASRSDRKSFPKDPDMNTIGKFFKNIWAAGSFKGTNGRIRIIPNPIFHLKNTKSWMKVITNWKGNVDFKGYALTGWQRYSHFSALCELLPVAIPTLALNLQFMKAPTDFDYVEVKASDCEDYDNLASETGLLGRCGFPGFDVFHLFSSYSEKLEVLEKLREFLNSGAFTFYNTFNNFTNSQYIQSLNEKKFNEHLYELNFMEKEIRIAMGEVYDEHTVDEWIMLHVMPWQVLLEATVNTIKVMNSKTVWPRRPFRSSTAHAWRHFYKFCNSNQTTGCTFFI